MDPMIKLVFISGLRTIVLDELKQYSDIVILDIKNDEIYISLPQSLEVIRDLKSVTHAYLARKDMKINPLFINNHKSLIGEMIEKIIIDHNKEFKTFSLSCAGSGSPEIQSIKKYIHTNYKLVESDDADLKISIGKLSDNSWELCVEITPRPISSRSYRVANLTGGLNPTIAHAMNCLGSNPSSVSYLNIFSGGATLLIEAGNIYKNLQLVGFDYDGKRNAEAIKNIKAADLIKRIKLTTADIFNNPDFGMFDIITSDLPFGMQINKDDDLEKLYTQVLIYSDQHLNPDGKLILYTSEYDLLVSCIENSSFRITQTLPLKIITSVNSYLYPKIVVCEFKR